jgi:hypothetical protein
MAALIPIHRVGGQILALWGRPHELRYKDDVVLRMSGRYRVETSDGSLKMSGFLWRHIRRAETGEEMAWTEGGSPWWIPSDFIPRPWHTVLVLNFGSRRRFVINTDREGLWVEDNNGLLTVDGAVEPPPVPTLSWKPKLIVRGSLRVDSEGLSLQEYAVLLVYAFFGLARLDNQNIAQRAT